MSNAAVFLVIFAGTAVLAVLSDRIRFFARHELLTGVMLVCVALAAILVRTLFVATDLCVSMLTMEVERIESDIDDQLSYGMRCGADVLIEYIARNEKLDRSAMIQAAEMLGLDEINIVDAKGVVIASNTNRTGIAFSTLLDNPESRKRYEELLSGERTTLKERFRDVITEPDEAIKYLGVRLPNGGILQLGYRWSTFGRDYEKYFLSMFEERKVGDSGFFLSLDGKGRVATTVASHPESRGMTLTDIGLEESDANRAADTQFLRRVFGRWCLCDTYERVGEYKGFAILPLMDVLRPAASSALFASIILIIFCVVFRLMLVRLHRAQAKIDALRAADEERRAADLALASAIQQAELRTDGTEGEGYRLATMMNAAREVGGDFYDYYELADGRLVITIADVSGKGVPAAFFMMKARMTLKSCVYSCATIAEAVARANVRLARNNPAEMFVTAWVGIYDRTTGELEFVSAGHNPPLARRADGMVEWIAAPRAAALGVFEMAKYRSARISLAAGDRLFLYTDGVTEAMNEKGELFGNDRLEATLKDVPGNRDAGLVPVVARAVETFVNGADQSDDITMLELEVRT